MSPTASYACKNNSNPIGIYLDSPLIFVGKYSDKGVEVNNNNAYKYYIFQVDEPLKGSRSTKARVYYYKDIDNISKDKKMLIVTSTGEGDRPYLHVCHEQLYDYSLPFGQSIYDFHHSVIGKLNLIVILTLVFASFYIFIIVKSHHTEN